MTDAELGVYGEKLAQEHLKQLGYNILVTNYKYLKFEIDIVTEWEDKIVVVEVKTRQTAEIGEPWRAVTKRKQRQIMLCANAYVQNRQVDKEVRFDIISIVHNQFRTNLEHLIDAFST